MSESNNEPTFRLHKKMTKSEIRNTIKKTINDCIMQCVEYSFDCFNNAVLNAIPRSNSWEESITDAADVDLEPEG